MNQCNCPRDDYEEQNTRSRTPTLDTVRQCMRDAMYARQLAKYQTMGYDI